MGPYSEVGDVSEFYGMHTSTKQTIVCGWGGGIHHCTSPLCRSLALNKDGAGVFSRVGLYSESYGTCTRLDSLIVYDLCQLHDPTPRLCPDAVGSANLNGFPTRNRLSGPHRETIGRSSGNIKRV